MIVRCARKYFNRFWLETARSTLPDHDHISSSAPSLDGKGGTDSAVKVGKSTKRTGPSHVYYRLYTELGPFKSNHPLYYHGRFIGRIPSKSFAPPHTVASIKWSLCKLEGLSEPDKARLFISLSSPAPGEDSARLSLYAPSGPGLSEHDPLVLVVESEKRTKEVSQAEKPPEDSEDTDVPYVYYRVYSSEGGDKKAKTSFDESDISLGRINALLVTPPHTAGSLKACIAKVEGLVAPGHALYKEMELFQDGDTYPGSDEGDPVALVINATANTAADPRAEPTPDLPVSNFTKRARLTNTYGYEKDKPTWLSINKDEIVYTDGVVLAMTLPSNNRLFSGYMVINSKGERGFVQQGNITFD